MSDPWFDDECRAAHKNCHWLQRRSRRSSEYLLKWRSELRCYRHLTRRKGAEFYRGSIDSHKPSSQHLWRSIDQLITSSLPSHHCHRVSQILYRQDRWRTGVHGANSAVYRSASGAELDVFQPVDVEEVSGLIASLPCKQCRTDPLPTWLLKECSVELAPYMCNAFRSRRCRSTLHTSLRCLRKPVWTVLTLL